MAQDHDERCPTYSLLNHVWVEQIQHLIKLAEGRRPDLPADLCRHLREDGLCEAEHDEDADHGG